jgi:broad specificity phosphatase PhoE
MAQLVLIRPGRTDFDEQQRIQGTLDIPLSEEGLADVDRLTSELQMAGIETVYTSPCQAAAQTAERLSEALGVRLKELDTLQNLNHGLWQGRCIEEVRQTQPKVYRQWQEHPESVCPPGGETVTACQERAVAVVSKLRRKHGRETVAVVAPEPLYSLLRCAVTGEEPRELWNRKLNGRRWEILETDRKELTPATP